MLQEFIARNKIRTVIHNYKDMKILFMESKTSPRKMQRKNWVRGLLSPYENLMELGERAISINADVPYPDPVPEMEFKTWMAIPLPVTGLERTEELYRLCFEAEAMLIHFLTVSASSQRIC
jgi:hypothetical protein